MSADPTPVSRRILLVDDNTDSAESLGELLALSGHEVRTAADGPAALRVYDEFLPDVVLCDLGLPGMSGYEVGRTLRTRPGGRALFLAALTGYSEASDRSRTAQAGFDLHLVKPVDPVELERLIDRI